MRRLSTTYTAKNDRPSPSSPSSPLPFLKAPQADSNQSDDENEGETSTLYFKKNLAQMKAEGKPPSYPTSAFCRFSQLRRAELKLMNPGLLQRKILEQIKKEWKNLATKQQFKDQAARDYQYYHKLRDIWEHEVKPGLAPQTILIPHSSDEPESALAQEARALQTAADSRQNGSSQEAQPAEKQNLIVSSKQVISAYPKLKTAQQGGLSAVREVLPQQYGHTLQIKNYKNPSTDLAGLPTSLTLAFSRTYQLNLERNNRNLSLTKPPALKEKARHPEAARRSQTSEAGLPNSDPNQASDADVLRSWFWPSTEDLVWNRKRQKVRSQPAEELVQGNHMPQSVGTR